MILRLSGADFSANNIGKIEINRELTQETIDILSHYTKTLNKNQKYALQEFIEGLKLNNIWERIENLYVPILAESVDEALYDIKGLAVDAIPSSDYYLLEDGGLRTKHYTSDTTIPSESRATIKVNGSYLNLHYMAYIGDTVFGEESHFSASHFMTSYSNSAYKGFNIFQNKVQNGWQTVMTGNPARTCDGISLSEIGDTIDGFTCISCDTDGYVLGAIGETYRTCTTQETVDTTISNVPTFIGCSVQGYAYCSTPMKIISTGYALTRSDMAKYKELCDTFISCFKKSTI